jgi:hypothetical protein
MFTKTVEKESIYRVVFISKNEEYQILARSVGNSSLFGFLEIDELVWGGENSVVIDPSEERLRNEFKDVGCTLIPLHTVVRVDILEKDKTGTAKILQIKEGNTVIPFKRMPIYTPTTND